MNEQSVTKTVSEIKTQKERVLERLQAGDVLSVRQIHVEMWINSPTKVMSDLRKIHGDKIKVHNKTDKRNYVLYEWVG